MLINLIGRATKHFFVALFYSYLMRFIILLTLVTAIISCSPSKPLIDVDEVYAWCIVPFDSENRTPYERIAMLKLIGIHSYAYDWREENMDEMVTEWELAEVNEIDINAVWMWIDANNDSINKLSDSNEFLLETMDEEDLETQIWIGFNSNYFEGLSDDEAVAKGTEMIKYLSKRAADIKCTIGLYNHGDWFGEPKNQMKVLEAAQVENAGLIYNFHHGHNHIDDFGELVDVMLPRLWAVNINGMEKDGSKILPIGEGDYEKQMIETLFDKGYDGPIGILGHVDTADVKEVLKSNLAGLKKMLAE